jgi:hypothetical protein
VVLRPDERRRCGRRFDGRDAGVACAGPSKPLHVNRNDSPLDVVEARLGLFGFPIDAPNSYEFALLINGHEVENGLYRVNAYD